MSWRKILAFEKEVNTATKHPPKRNEHLTKGNAGPGSHGKKIRRYKDDAAAGSKNGHQDRSVHGVGHVCWDTDAQGVVRVRTERIGNGAIHDD